MERFDPGGFFSQYVAHIHEKSNGWVVQYFFENVWFKMNVYPKHKYPHAWSVRAKVWQDFGKDLRSRYGT